MFSVARTVHIDAPVERVWSVITDVRGWPRWAGYMKSLEPQDGRPLRLGARVKVTPRGIPGGSWEVTEYEPPHSFTWESRPAPGLRLTGGHLLEREDAGTSATFSLAATGLTSNVALPALAAVFRRNTRLATEGLKRFCEAQRDG